MSAPKRPPVDQRPVEYSDRPTSEWGGSITAVFWWIVAITFVGLVCGIGTAIVDPGGAIATILGVLLAAIMAAYTAWRHHRK